MKYLPLIFALAFGTIQAEAKCFEHGCHCDQNLAYTQMVVNTPDATVEKVGVPKVSDVCFSSRSIHIPYAKSPLDTIASFKAFHATRMNWMYINQFTPAQIVKQFVSLYTPLHIPTQMAISGDIYPPFPQDPKVNPSSYGVKLDINQKIIAFPGSGRNMGCPASSVLMTFKKKEIKDAFSFSFADSIQFDDPGFWNYVPRVGPGFINYRCYCDYCLSDFRTYLKNQFSEGKISSALLKSEGVTTATTPDKIQQDIAKFDFRTFVLAKKWNPNGVFPPHPIETWYASSAYINLNSYWTAVRSYILALNPHYKMSGNFSRWHDALDMSNFDYSLAECQPDQANPQFVYDTCKAAEEAGKIQVFTTVSSDIARSRRMTALTTASDGCHIVPWDVFVLNEPRLYGNPQDFADVYAFIRYLGPHYLDGYKIISIKGGTIPAAALQDPSLKALPSLSIDRPSVVAYIRQNTSNQVVFHLVDVQENRGQVTPVTLTVKKADLLPSVHLTGFVTTKTYDQAAHDGANQTGDYSKTVQLENLQVSFYQENGETWVKVEIPDLRLWGVIF